MKFFFLIICVIGALCFFLLGIQPQQRGLYNDMLLSTARPALCVVPGDKLCLLESGWCDVQPPARVSGTQGQARVWYALYEARNPDRRLLVLFAETGNLWEWPYTFQKNHRDWARVHKLSWEGMTLHQGAYVLEPDRDPWGYHAEGVWAAGSVVQHVMVLRQFNTFKVIVEYREPLSLVQGDIPVLEDIPALAGLQQRSTRSFRLLRQEGGKENFGAVQRLEKAPSVLSRRVLAHWLGEIQRRGGRE